MNNNNQLTSQKHLNKIVNGIKNNKYQIQHYLRLHAKRAFIAYFVLNYLDCSSAQINFRSTTKSPKFTYDYDLERNKTINETMIPTRSRIIKSLFYIVTIPYEIIKWWWLE